MKKSLSIILCILMVLGLFLMPAAAEGEEAILADDLSSIAFEGNTYIQCDTSMLFNNYWSESNPIEAKFSKEQEGIKKIYVETSITGVQLWAEITYKNGSVLSATYLREELIPLYEQLLTATDVKVEINFEWPDGNLATAIFSDLITEDAITIKNHDLLDGDYFEVYAKNDSKNMQVSRGQLLLIDDEFYYMDYSENNIDETYSYPGDYPSLLVHLVTDEVLLEQLRVAEHRYMGLGSPFGEAFTKVVGICVVALLLGVLPLALLVFSLILMLKAKKSAYKKQGLILMIASLATFIIFLALALMILL